ncbi:hypothetical protein MY5147_005969 [Beauveria neobassiana]
MEPLAEEVVPEDEAPADEEAPEEDDCDAPPVGCAPGLLAPGEADDAVLAVGTAPSVSLSRPEMRVTGCMSEIYPVVWPVVWYEDCVSLLDSVSETEQLATSLDEVREQVAVNAL